MSVGAQESTQEQGRDSGAARVLPATTAGGQHHVATHSSWTGERSLEAELEYQSTLASFSLIDEPEPVCVGHDGRYAIRRLIGRGAMGAVYFADDLALRRPVAIKVVSKIVGDRQHFQDRLRREAWALALLDHPNVLQVYDVDLAASGELFIVMQYVAGMTLRDWVEREQPSRAQLFEVFVAAGRGLAAAHRKGLVHRDFKPDNVLIRAAESGEESLAQRVLVADFGLAGGAALELAAVDAGKRAALQLDALPVHTARFLGTPAYMSPEQRRCEALDGRSDQYAFCVSMWELLLGERPLASLVARRPRELAPWIYRLLRRGLSPDPSERYANMLELLDALEHTPARRRRWLSLAGAAGIGAVLVLGGAALAQVRADARQARAVAPDPCAEVASPLVEVWNPARKTEIEAHIAGLQLPGAQDLAARTGALLDRAAARWREDRRASCTQAPLAPSPCHARWLARFDRRVQLLSSLDAGQASHIVRLVEPLVSNSICALPPAPLDPQIEASLESAQAHSLLADYDEALELARQAYAAAASLPGCGQGQGEGEFSLERGAAAYRIGDIYGELHDGGEALLWLRRAQRHARACGDDAGLLAAQLRATKIQTVDLREHEQAHEALLDAESLLARQLGTSPELEWELRLTRGLVALEQGEHAQAQSWLREALALPDAERQPLRSTEALINLGVALYLDGQADEAMARFDEAAMRVHEAYGSFVPELDLVSYDRATLLLADEDEAQRARGRALLEGLRDSPHVNVRLSVLTTLARVHAQPLELDALRSVTRELQALLDEHPGQGPLDRALALYWVGQVRANDGEAEGLELLREALALFERVAPARPERDDCELSLAWNLLEQGMLEQARAHHEALRARPLSANAAGLLPQFAADLAKKDSRD